MWSTDRLRVGSGGEAGTCGGHSCGPGESSSLCVQRLPGSWTASLPPGPERQLNRPPPPRHIEHRLLREAGQEQTAVGMEGGRLPRRASRSLFPGGAQVPHQHTCQGSLSPTCRSNQVIDLSLQQCPEDSWRGILGAGRSSLPLKVLTWSKALSPALGSSITALFISERPPWRHSA